MERNKSKYYGRRLKKPDFTTFGGYTKIPNAFILNPEIGDAELRLLSYLLAQSSNFRIKSNDCFKYLGKTKQAVNPQFKKLVEHGILKITNDIIEIIVPEEMTIYKIGYLKGIENNPDVVKNTLPFEEDGNHQVGQENFTNKVNKTLPSDKGNLTSEVKKTLRKPLEGIDIEASTGSIIKNNTTRVLPVPATSGSTGQSHPNDNTKDNTGSKLDLERDAHQSQASPSVLAPLLHTPKREIDNGDYESLPIEPDYSDILPNKDEALSMEEEVLHPTIEPEPLPIEPDKRFMEQLKTYDNSKYFLPEKLDKVKNLYSNYAEQYPNRYMPIKDFEEVLVYLMTATLGMVKLKGINFCLMYSNDICHRFQYIPKMRLEMIDNPEETEELLQNLELDI